MKVFSKAGLGAESPQINPAWLLQQRSSRMLAAGFELVGLSADCILSRRFVGS